MSSLDFMIDTGRENGIKSAEFMKKFDEFHLRLEADPLSGKVTSITYVLKKKQKALHGTDMEFYYIPDDDKAVSQYLFVYETSGGNEMDRLVIFMFDKASVIVRHPSLSAMEGRKFRGFAVKTADEIFGSEMSLAMSGGLYTGICVLMIFFLKGSATACFPCCHFAGLLGLCGVYLDVILISFAPIIIGISVDDTSFRQIP